MKIDFELPDELSATAPPEFRDEVRLLVAAPGAVRHAWFSALPAFLEPGDLVVVNTSQTLAAAVDGRREDGRPVIVHFSTELDDGDWLVELRSGPRATGPVADACAGERVRLPAGVAVRLVQPHRGHRLWRAQVSVEGTVADFLARVGRPIAYAYVSEQFPIDEYQTVFARDPGSAEMPSAGRPFTDRLVTDLAVRGITIAPITLHTGVSSLDAGERPLAERFHVSATTARVVNETRAAGGRIVAVGTTVTRALESVIERDGRVRADSGWTDVILTPDRPARVVNGLITGWHAPGASHLDLLEAVAGADLVQAAYEQALAARYLWHEFGDSCLLLP